MLVFPRLLHGGVSVVHTFAVFIPCAAAVTSPMQTIPNILLCAAAVVFNAAVGRFRKEEAPTLPR